MASIRLQPPDPFDFRHPDEWQRWKRRFEQYHIASRLADEEVRQVSTLLYCMGEEAGDVLKSTNISDADRKKYEKVTGKFDEFFKVRGNVIFERARFNRRNQRPGETAEEYITALYGLIDLCEYGALKDELLRDRIVVGIADRALSERMQLDSKLTLETAKNQVRQKEAVTEQHRQLQNGDAGSKANPIVLSQVAGRARRGQRFQPKPAKGVKPSSSQVQSGAKGKQSCKRCGKEHSTAGERCPARGATCFKCKKKGHFGAQCFSKQVSEATTKDSDMDSIFLGAVESGQSSWKIELLVHGHPISFKLDTGAEVTAIAEKDYYTLGAIPLKPSTLALYGPAQQSLNVKGQFKGKLTLGQKTSIQTIYVIRGLKTNLLGLPAITSLNLASRIDSTEADLLPADLQRRFPKLFEGLGTLGGNYTIKLKDGATPHALFTPRNVPIPLRGKVKEELLRMEQLGVIRKVVDPTPWCAGMVVVPKSSGAVRICVDLKPLNENVLRETHPMPSVDDTLAQLTGAAVFSKVDANSGFWQIPLAEESQHLTTFITPFGRYCFQKLPFGISSAPELFQGRMSQILSGLEGVICHIDDVLIFGANTEEHDSRLAAVLTRLETVGVTLNKDKCEFHKQQIKFLGHVIDKEGVRPDPNKIAAVLEMTPPTNITQLRRFMGMVNQLGKFSRKCAEISQPLRELLSTKRAWLWGPEQENAFLSLKEELTRPTVLSLYDPSLPAKISADASSYGVGAVLLQQTNGDWKPVAYACRAMSEAEKRYAQIEKEALATTWACERFSNYLLGRHFHVETDHKPLVPLLSSKHLDDLPPRILRFCLRLARYDFSIQHVPGKLLNTADTLSRAPHSEAVKDTLQCEVETFMDAVVASLPATSQRLEVYRQEQTRDPICSQVKKYCVTGWPAKSTLPALLGPYWKVRDSLSIGDGLLLYNSRIVVPHSLKTETLMKIHEGHQGITRCRMRTKSSVWWPGISAQVQEMIQKCRVCARDADPHQEPMTATPRLIIHGKWLAQIYLSSKGSITW